MRILYLTTVDPRAQGDFLEVMMLHGLRMVLGDHVVDLPRKKVMYGDFSESPKQQLHGKGFTLYTRPIPEVRSREVHEVDVVLYGVTDAYGITDYPELNRLCRHVWYLDGHDDMRIRKKPCFKRELERLEPGVMPTGFGIPSYQIRPLSFSERTKLFQRTAPHHASFQPVRDLATQAHHIYTDEEEYFRDMQTSWFGLTSIKGGWDCLRHYEILASGACLLFRDYDQKPPFCSPQALPTISYSTPEELQAITRRLLPEGRPTGEYFDLVMRQRQWLLQHGTAEARALGVLRHLAEVVRDGNPMDLAARV